MILFLGHGPRPRTNPNAAGGVALGWVPLVLFLRFAYLFVLLEHVGTHLLCWNWWVWICLDSIFDRFWGK